MPRLIEVVEYNKDWPALYEKEANRLRNSVIGQMHRNLDLAIKAGERIVRVNKSLQRAIHLRDESG